MRNIGKGVADRDPGGADTGQGRRDGGQGGAHGDGAPSDGETMPQQDAAEIKATGDTMKLERLRRVSETTVGSNVAHRTEMA